ncbi:hypothetical protein EAI_10492 [Harpegnathos saltator]|uniref:Uncharacterized protein n=1 Tax=Harpegnathos saltator TaxID=610380 RepID=E2BY04_HARSA|nr:hypothetical protein EAI_10492 [Harpegnathos saltator]
MGRGRVFNAARVQQWAASISGFESSTMPSADVTSYCNFGDFEMRAWLERSTAQNKRVSRIFWKKKIVKIDQIKLRRKVLCKNRNSYSVHKFSNYQLKEPLDMVMFNH